MNHTDWFQLGFSLLTVLMSFFGSHFGAKNGVNSANDAGSK